MALESGQITGQDLSPSANILGTQIADKTLQFRNFSEDVFKIVKSFTVPLTITLDGTGHYTQSVQQAHGLTYTPSYQAFINIDPSLAGLTSGIANNGPNPFIIAGVSGVSVTIWGVCQVSVDSTNINFVVYCAIGGTGSTLSFSTKVYLLQETAN